MKCHHASTSYAYIVDNISDNVNKQTKIYISEYLTNKELCSAVKKGTKYIVCSNNQPLKSYNSEQRKSHFAHIKHNDEVKIGMWHTSWTALCKVNNIDTECKLISNNIADAKINNITLEFQHSYIRINYANERSQKHKDSGYNIMWLIDCTDDTLELFQCGKIYLMKFITNNWKYKTFIDMEYIYLHHDDNIFRIKPSEVISEMIYVNNYMSVKNFIKSLKSNKIKWQNYDIPQCNLYIKQMGAGCGKTYDSIQLLNNINDELFAEKTTYIYLTKMKTAVSVIREEIEQQAKSKKLKKTNLYDVISNAEEGKQFKCDFVRNDRNCKVIVGTIDSFMYRLGNKKHNEKDYFTGIINSICNNNIHLPNNTVKYPTSTKLSKEIVIIVDEAQDLPEIYIDALTKIMFMTNIDVYVIGDKLQSIWHAQNVFTWIDANIEKYNAMKNIKITRLEGDNTVRRFHNEKFINYVNNIVPFSNFGLPKIQGICDIKCKYKHNDDNGDDPFVHFSIPAIYGFQDDNLEDKIINCTNEIINYMKIEIKKHNYLPKNFMFIFSHLSGNALASALEMRLMKFWKTQFNKKKYNKNVVKKDLYWKTIYDKDKYLQYVVFHKSSEGNAINLKESENATRILSIHASKGSGCEVVFLLGVSEKSLHFYSKETHSLKYESLLHVALTRQKLKLYIGFENDNNDISKRFNKQTKTNNTLTPPVPNMKLSVKESKIRALIDQPQNGFTTLNDIFNITNIMNETFNNNININKPVDWGHHIIRALALKTQFMLKVYNNEKYEDEKKQMNTIFMKLSNLTVMEYQYKEYYIEVAKFNNNNKDTKQTNFPILYFTAFEQQKYIEYKNSIIEIVKHIQKKLKFGLSNIIDKMCPIETVIFQHMLDINSNNIYAETTIMDVYNILLNYDSCGYVHYDEHHINNEYNCKCNGVFKKITQTQQYKDTQTSITQHYNILTKVDNIYENYKKHIDHIFNETFTYNIAHLIKIQLEEDKKGMKIYKSKTLIAYSQNYVISFMIKPQINTLNFNELFIEMIMDQFIIKHCDGNNKHRYDNKRVIHCCISLDSDVPIFYDINKEFNSEYNKIVDIIEQHTVSYFIDELDILYQFCEHRRKTNTNCNLKLEYCEYVSKINYGGNKSIKPLTFINDILSSKNIIKNGLSKDNLNKEITTKIKYLFNKKKLLNPDNTTPDITEQINYNHNSYNLVDTDIYERLEDGTNGNLIGSYNKCNIINILTDNQIINTNEDIMI